MTHDIACPLHKDDTTRALLGLSTVQMVSAVSTRNWCLALRHWLAFYKELLSIQALRGMCRLFRRLVFQFELLCKKQVPGLQARKCAVLA